MVLSSLRLQFYLSLLLLRICQELLTVACPAIKEERLTTKRGLAASITRGRPILRDLKWLRNKEGTAFVLQKGIIDLNYSSAMTKYVDT